MPIGYSDLKKVLQLPGTWDLDYLAKWETADGVDFGALLSRVGSALVVFNRTLTSGYWGQYLRVTDEMTLEYFTGNSGELEKMGEYGRPDPIVGKYTGGMLPLHDYGGALGWTYQTLRRAPASRLEKDIRALIDRSRNTWEKRVLERLFESAAETVGSSGKSVPFADGGTADSDFVPPSHDGQDFTSSHDHFLRKADTDAGRASAVNDMAEHLREHGIMPPYDLVIPEVDRSVWVGLNETGPLAKFVKPERGVFSTAGVETRAAVPEEIYLGVIECDLGWFRVKETPRVPANYAGAFKPRGFGNVDNPLAIRREEGHQMGIELVGQIDHFPMQEAIAQFTFGAGIGNRLAGAATYFAASGSYTDPTIS